jgi:glycogen synthase
VVKRLLFLTPAFPPFQGGGERYVHSLALALNRRGHPITIMTSHAQREADFWRPSLTAPTEETLNPTMRVIRCPLAGFRGGRAGLLAWRKLMVLLSALPGDQSRLLMRMAGYVPPISGLAQALSQLPEPVDLLHLFNLSWEYPMVEGWRWAQERRCPFIVTPFAHLGSGGHDRVARNSLMDHQQRILREAGAVQTLTSIEEEALIQICGLDPQRVTTVGSGLDPLPTTIPVTETVSRYQLQPPFILFIGRLSYDKGALHAAEAVLALRDQGSAASLALVGQATPEFNRFYHSLREEERLIIRPLHILPEEEKHALLSAATMLLLPSRTDSFGIVLLEAWAHGKPVIGANAGGIPGVIDDGHDGLLVPFGDVAALASAIQHLLTNDTLRRTMGNFGKTKIAEQYTWEQVAGRVETGYERLLRHS